MNGDSVRRVFLQNIPNMLTISRIVLTFVVIYQIFTRTDIIIITTTFALAAITDWFDGRLARKYRWESEFGRKADMIADRFLWVGTALAFVTSFGMSGNLKPVHGLQLMMIMSRELISAPFALIAFFSGNLVPHARYIAKVTTFVQGFALPAIILSAFYPIWIWVSFPLSLACLVTGAISALYYLKDIHAPHRNIKRKKVRKSR